MFGVCITYLVLTHQVNLISVYDTPVAAVSCFVTFRWIIIYKIDVTFLLHWDHYPALFCRMVTNCMEKYFICNIPAGVNRMQHLSNLFTIQVLKTKMCSVCILYIDWRKVVLLTFILCLSKKGQWLWMKINQIYWKVQ